MSIISWLAHAIPVIPMLRREKMDVVSDAPVTSPPLIPVVSAALNPEPVPAEIVPVTISPPRSLDQIHTELVAAQATHAAAVQDVAASTTLVGTLRAELHAAITWFQQEEKQLLADFDDAVSAGESWIVKAIKAI